MRKIILLMGIVLLALTGFVGGTIMTVQAFSYETGDGARYNYFSNPKLVTAQNNYIYLIDGERGYESLLKINVESGLTVDSANLTETEEPKHIAVANNLLFVFYPTKFYTYSITDLSQGGYYLYSGATTQQTAFHVTHVTGNTYYIYHGQGANAMRKTFATSYISGSSLATGVAFNLYSQAVNGISTNSANNRVYFLATDPYSSSQFRIYEAPISGGTPQYIDNTDQNFFNARQFSYFNGVYYFLSHDGSLPKLTAYHDDTPSYLENDFAYQNFITMKKSIRPIAIHVVDASKIFVIDEEKQSIDMYSYDVVTREFAHERIVAGHKGDDSGYYYEPLSVCVIDETRYVVADRTGVKLIKNGFTSKLIERGDGDKQVAQVRQIAFDMWENIYIYDSKKRIQIYKLLPNDNVEHVGTLTNNGNFDKIVQLVADIDQSVWALDSTANCVWQIKSNHAIVRHNFQSGVTVNTNSRGIVENGDFELLQEMSNIETTKIDAVIDALETPVYITQDNLNQNKYFVESENLDQPRIEIVGASPVSPFSLSLDRFNGKLFWIGANYSIQSLNLSDYGYWSPKDYPHYNWNNIDNKMEYVAHAKDRLYMKVAADAVLYKYPGAIKPQDRISYNSNVDKYVQVLQYETVMGSENLNWAYVLYHPFGTQNMEPLYISHKFIETSDDFAIEDSSQFTNKFSNSNTTNSGRVILRNTLVYLYPSSASPTISTIHKNHGIIQEENRHGLIISREIKIPDYDGLTFYEIRVDASGQPPTNGIVSDDYLFVGYVNTANVVDVWAAPSVVTGFATNGKIKVSREHNDGKGAQVFSLTSPHEPHEGEFLKNNTRIRIIGEYGDGFTHIAYTSAWATEDGIVGEDLIFYGLVRTSEIDPDGITWWQICAIIALVLSLGVGIFIGIKYWRQNKK